MNEEKLWDGVHLEEEEEESEDLDIRGCKK
jgi:hypothetical protein